MRSVLDSIRIYLCYLIREIADMCAISIPIIIIGVSIALCIGLIVLAFVYPVVWTIKHLFF